MKNIILLAFVTMLVGCSLSLDDVKVREAACKAEGGQVLRRMTVDKVIVSVDCDVDGAVYWVAPSGALK